MKRISNRGILYLQTEPVKTVKFQFQNDKLLFTHNQRKVSVNPDGINLYCDIYDQGKKQTAFYDKYDDIISVLLNTDIVTEALHGQLVIRDIPFLITLFSEGCLLSFDVGTFEQLYSIVIKERAIFVSSGIKQENPKDIDAKNMEQCDDFFSALAYIYEHASELFKELIGEDKRLLH